MFMYVKQKNPTAVRTAEEDRGLEKHTLDMMLNLDHSHILSPHIYNICQDGVLSAYTKESDIRILSQGNFTSLHDCGKIGLDQLTLCSNDTKVSVSNYSQISCNIVQNSEYAKIAIKYIVFLFFSLGSMPYCPQIRHDCFLQMVLSKSCLCPVPVIFLCSFTCLQMQFLVLP